jgi:gamma-glutamyl:cysteine ligase YbdK (ATP-grasp superfamily)
MAEERLDWFMGSVFLGAAEVTQEMRDLMLAQAEHYLRACGSVPWSDWERLSSESRGAFQEAGQRIERERAKMIVQEVAELLRTEIPQT